MSEIFHIFQLKKIPLEKGHRAPVLDENNPLSIFYHADSNLVQRLKDMVNTYGYPSRRQIKEIHFAQKIFLDSIYLIYDMLDSSVKQSREYRKVLPQNDQNELNSG
jgi:hypothetical protein